MNVRWGMESPKTSLVVKKASICSRDATLQVTSTICLANTKVLTTAAAGSVETGQVGRKAGASAHRSVMRDVLNAKSSPYSASVTDAWMGRSQKELMQITVRGSPRIARFSC